MFFNVIYPYIFSWDSRKNISQKISKVGLFLISCFWEMTLHIVLIVGGILALSIEGASAVTYLFISVLYILTAGRKGIFSSQHVFSLAMTPCYLPAILFYIPLLPSIISTHSFSLAESVIWISLSQWTYLLEIPRGNLSRRGILTKLLFFVGIQCSYGLAFHSLYPELLEPLEWAIALPELRPAQRYQSKTEIQFFYDDKKEADIIEDQLPGIVDILSRSPFYQGAAELVLIQKPKMVMNGLTESESSDMGGVYYRFKQYSYYFSEVSSTTSSDTTYCSHANPHRAVPLHELIHQMLARYYGKWYSMYYLETWKNEGYAEYMVGIDYYSTKAELRAILTDYNILDEQLGAPFSKTKSAKKYNIGIKDYIAAFLQTRYALDVKKISPIDFFKSTYKAASAQEIKDWLLLDYLPE